MGIIPKIIPLLIIVIALFLRLYNITGFAEFLGDQGRTGIVIYEAWRDRAIPLVGPTVLTGQHLGPIWYYLIGPFYILAGFNPLGPAIGMAIYGSFATAALYVLSKNLFGRLVGSIVAVLWAVSPIIVHQDQVIWEPNLVPLFVILFLLGLTTRRNLLVWAATGVLVQLHYPNIIFVPIALVVTRFSLWGILLFLVILAPFFMYEIQHRFSDVVGVVNVMSQPSAISKRQFLSAFIDYTSRVFYRVIPTGNQIAMIVIQIMLAGVIVFTKNRFLVLLLGLYVVGISAMAKYQGLVYDHYLNFLLPLPFLFVGNALSYLRRYSKLGAIIVGAVLILWHVTKPDYFTLPRDDIGRTSTIASAIIADTKSNPYSFTVIGSPSFNDLHFRYFFLLGGSSPSDIRSGDYEKLYVICEIGQMCPSQPTTVDVMCFDYHCNGEYPKLNLTKWSYIKTIPIDGSYIYVFDTMTL